jgi:hypothetical protein
MFWPYFSRCFWRHCPHLGSIYSYLQSHIDNSAKSPGDLPVLHISNHHSCQSHSCILRLYCGRATGGSICHVRGAVSVLGAQTGSLIPMIGVYIFNRREFKCGRYILLENAHRGRNDLATDDGIRGYDYAIWRTMYGNAGNRRLVSAEIITMLSIIEEPWAVPRGSLQNIN